VASQGIDLDFFFDPVCPWAWVTSRWVEGMARAEGLGVDWRPISLRIVNGHRDYNGDFAHYREVHERGLRLLRVAAAVREELGRQAVSPLYRELGAVIHIDKAPASLDEPSTLALVLERAGVPGRFAEAAQNEALDASVRRDTEEALERTGGDIGTPVLTFRPPDGPSFFGPVIARVPDDDETARRLWTAVTTLADFPEFAELKRNRRPPLDPGNRAQVGALA